MIEKHHIEIIKLKEDFWGVHTMNYEDLRSDFMRFEEKYKMMEL